MEGFNKLILILFGQRANSVSASDLTTIANLEFPRLEHDIRLLFFPTGEDLKNGLLQSKLLKVADEFKFKPFPSMSTFRYNHMHQVHEFHTRRPHFLLCLDDNEYCNAFRALMHNKSKPLATWMTWTNKLNKEVWPAVNVLKNIMYWFEPGWKYPEGASTHLQTFQWDNEVINVVFKR